MHSGDDTLMPVVITRPLAQARSMQQKIMALGRQSIIFPLLEISALDDNATLDAVLRNLSHYALIAFVSPNAIDAAFARGCPWPLGVPFAVMGEGSRQALAAHGIIEGINEGISECVPAGNTAGNSCRIHKIYSPCDVDRTDSQTLLAALDLASLAGKNVLIVRGDGGRELLADALRGVGASVTQVTAYKRAAPAIGDDDLLRLRDLLDMRCQWIVTSSEALRILLQWTKRLDQLLEAENGASTFDGNVNADVGADTDTDAGASTSVATLRRQVLLVPHVRIAETATALGFSNIVRTTSGDTGLLAALQFRHE